MRKKADRSPAGTRAAPMDREKLQSFIRAAGADLSSVRSSLLIVAQAGDASDLAISRLNLVRLKPKAPPIGLTQVPGPVSDCEPPLTRPAQPTHVPPNPAHPPLV